MVDIKNKAVIPFSYRESGSIGRFKHNDYRPGDYTPGNSLLDWTFDCYMSLAEAEHQSFECYIAGQRFTVELLHYGDFIKDLKRAVSFALMDDQPDDDRATLMYILEELNE